MVKSSEDRRSGRQRMDAGELAPLVAEFRHHLSEAGHTDLTVRGFDGAARHLSQWLAQAKVTVANIDETVIDRFARHRCRCPGMRREKHVSDRYVRRVHRFVEFLGERGLVRHKVTSAVPVLDRRVIEFQDWLRQHRGISERTIDRHGRMIMRLLPALGPRPRRWDAQLIREVILAETKRTSRTNVKTHDLRHTFAVRSLEQCRHDRAAVARHIVALSTYLGHAHVTDTYWYLQATPVLMGQIAEAGEALLLGGAA